MKRILILVILIAFLTGCSTIYDLTNFIVPDDEEFIAVIESLDTPKKICAYMDENFEWEFRVLAYSPYQMWLENVKKIIKSVLFKVGDCNDMSCFAAFAANYHGYTIYQIRVEFKETLVGHFLCVFVEEGKYTYSSNTNYYPIFVDSFEDIVLHYFERATKELRSYKVYDYNMNLVIE